MLKYKTTSHSIILFLFKFSFIFDEYHIFSPFSSFTLSLKLRHIRIRRIRLLRRYSFVNWTKFLNLAFLRIIFWLSIWTQPSTNCKQYSTITRVAIFKTYKTSVRAKSLCILACQLHWTTFNYTENQFCWNKHKKV